MERDFNNDEFEDFLKQKVDQHKLYPSDKAWKGIYNSLHPGMKWFKIGGTLLVVSTLFIVYQESSYFNSSHLSSKNPVVNDSKVPNVTSVIKQIPTSSGGSSSLNAPLKSFTGGAINSIAKNSTIAYPGSAVADLPTPSVIPAEGVKIAKDHLEGFLLHNNPPLKLSIQADVVIPSNQLASVPDQNTIADSNSDNENVNSISSSIVGNTITDEEAAASVKDFNWLQEMAAIKLTPQKKSKFNFQFYFSPTVSYRRLADNQNTSHTGPLSTAMVTRDLNINRYVDHNPAIGAELGSNVLFSLTRNFTIKSGIQLNYSRYNIKAYRTTSEKASIALSTAGPVADTLSSYTSIRNFSGYAPEELQNQYLQVSVPIGAELKLLGNKRLQLNVAGTIQPTFLLFSDTYLLSTNYLNYTKEPSLVRRWNLHSSVEAFLSYKTGGLRWQLGPQFRYQLMSSYNDRYPIKEYLIEYGFKIGVSKTLR